MFRNFYLALAFPLLLFGTGFTHAEVETETEVTPVGLSTELVIATRATPPFAVRTESGWEGISIELIKRLAEQGGFSYRLLELGLDEMLAETAAGNLDAAVSAVTITAEREAQVDFTHPFFNSSLGIVVRSESSWLTSLLRLFSGAFLQVVAALLALLTLVGVLIWLAERRRNDQFSGGAVKGVGSGLWWSAVTMTTVGYGDKAPVTPLGRLLGLVWMFASIIIISTFTAAIATSLTVGSLQQAISGVEDLTGARVVTVAGSTSTAFLDERRIRYQTVADAEAAVAQVAAGEADAAVYDKPILRYLVNRDQPESVIVLPHRFAPQDYGIALPPGSPNREALNRGILSITETPAWRDLLYEWLGPED